MRTTCSSPCRHATTSARRNYTLDPTTGALTPIEMGPFTAAFPRQTSGGVDFNPGPDRLRIVLPQDQNLHVGLAAPAPLPAT